ncbi:MAG: RHS repeat protein [Nitrospira sp. CG24D]|nr:MAG: RHS repeat protein [Nitrospira sp. CG24D]
MSRVRAMRERCWRPVSPSCWRTYQTNGTVTGPFGRGTTHATQIVMLVDGNQRIVRMGDGLRFTLTLQPDGAYRNLTDAGLQGAVLTSPGGVPTLRWKDGSRWVFGVTLSSAVGITNLGLTQQIDRTGNSLTNTWSGTRITAIAGPDGRQLTLDYDGANRVTKVSDPIGRSVQYAYDGQGNLATVTDPEGGTTRYAYNSTNRLTTITDAKGILFLQNFYGPSGRVLRQLQADGSEYRFRYQLTGATASGAGCLVLNTNPPSGGVVVLRSDFFSRCPSVDSWENLQAGYTITGGTVTGTTVVDPRGNVTTTRFNTRGYPVSTTDALGQTSTTTLTAANQVASSTDALGRITKFEYDPAGNVTKITDPNNQPTVPSACPTRDFGSTPR